MLPNFNYVRATSLKQAIGELAAPGARLHAGGTDLLGCLRNGVFSASKLVSISGIAELRGIGKPAAGGLRIGALATLTEVAGHPEVVKQYAALAQGAASAASPQLRNQGTLGGNLCQRPRCWYFREDFQCLRKGGNTCYAYSGENEFHCILGGAGCYYVHPSDTAAPLVALDAQVRVTGPKGPRTVPMAAFFVPPVDDLTRETALQPGEILTEVLLPAPAAGMRSSYRKVRARASWDFALAGVALAVTLVQGKVARARVVLSGVAPVPWRCAEAEKFLEGKTLGGESASPAAALCVKGAEALSGNAYKIDLVRGIVEEALNKIAA